MRLYPSSYGTEHFNQGWWSRLNFNGFGSYSGARFTKLLNSNSGSGAGHLPFIGSTPAPFDLNFAGSGSASARSNYFFKSFKNCWSLEPHKFMTAPAQFQFFKMLRLPSGSWRKNKMTPAPAPPKSCGSERSDSSSPALISMVNDICLQ